MRSLRKQKPRNNLQIQNSEFRIKNYNSKFKISLIVSKIILIIAPIHIYKIMGLSMKPVLNNGEFVLVNKLGYMFHKPKVGEVAALWDPRDGKVLIKRITKIVDNKYFVEGDNRGESTDSRHFGLVERKSIIGKVIWSSRF